jgi:hypothetical protein
MLTKLLSYLTAPVRGLPKWRAYRVEDVRRVVTAMRVLMRDAANGGVEQSGFMQPENEALEAELDDLVHRVHDRKLRKLCGEVLDNYKATFGAAPSPTGPRIYSMTYTNPAYAEEDQRYSEQVARQHDDATATLESIEAVLRKLDKLEFFVTS